MATQNTQVHSGICTPFVGRRAFTLIELLVVISIISLLVAILLPVLGNARKMVQQTKCMANLRQIGMGVYGYTNDFKDYYMPRGTKALGRGLPPSLVAMKTSSRNSQAF